MNSNENKTRKYLFVFVKIRQQNIITLFYTILNLSTYKNYTAKNNKTLLKLDVNM